MRTTLIIVSVALACITLTCGCTGGEANVTLNTSGVTVTGYDDNNMTVDYQVSVTARDTGNVRAREVTASVTVQQVEQGDEWTERIVRSGPQSAEIDFGTIALRDSATKTVTVTLTGTPDTYQALKSGEGVEVTAHLSHVSSGTVPWIDTLF